MREVCNAACVREVVGSSSSLWQWRWDPQPKPSAQSVTTGAISGLVEDESGAVLPGASVVGVHEPTGSEHTAVTGADGRFTLLNLRAGGPTR